MIASLVRVGEISDQLRGVSYGKADAVSEAKEGYLPVLRAGNITASGLVFDDLVWVPAARITSKQRIKKGDVVIAASSGSLDVVGKAAMAQSDYKGGFGAFCKVMRPNPAKVEPAYFSHYFQTREYRQKISLLAAGANINNLKNEHLDDLLIPLPSIPEQRRIAAILDQADALRAKRREALAQLDELQRAIFIEMFGDYRTGQNSWPEESFEQIATETKIGLVRGAEQFGPDFDIPYVRMNAIGRSGEFFPDLVLRTNASKQELEEYSLKQGDFLFNTRNSKELVGKTALFREQGEYVYNNNLMRIRFKHGVEPEYVAAAFLTPYIQHELEIRKAGTTSVFAIYARELKSLPVPIPPLELQKVFAGRTKAIESLKSQHHMALNFLDSLFSSLQHRAFRGEL